MKHSLPYLLGAVITMSITYSTTGFAEDSSAFTYDEVKAEKVRHKKESTGLLTGFVLGGLAAGPGGAIIGAVGGSLFGNHLNSEQEREQLLTALDGAESAYAQLARENREMETKYQLAMEELQNSRLRTVSLTGDTQTTIMGDTTLAIHFRTNSTSIEPHYQNQLTDFANFARTHPDTLVRITGFADARGDTQSNLALSQQRVASVETILKSQGLDTTVQTIAYGESRPVSTDDSLENYFYDRRVEISLHKSNGELLTNAGN